MRRHIIAAAVLLALSPSMALAQTSPNLTYGQVLTAAQWNALFARKTDFLGSPPCLTSACVMTGELTTVAPTATTSGLNLPHGTAPTTPNNGDLWTTTGGIFVEINGATIGPLAQGSGGSFSATLPLAVTFPSSVVNYALRIDNTTLGVTGGNLAVNLTNPNSWSGVQTFGNSDIRLLGSAGGYTTFTSANTGVLNYITTVPANTGTVAELNLAQTWTAGQIFNAAMTYGGVVLSNSVSGTGSMVLATAPSVSSLTVTTAFTATGLDQRGPRQRGDHRQRGDVHAGIDVLD